jgi:hypothetical protein
VIAHLAARRPARVVHIFCGIETVPGAVAEWGKAGYTLSKCVPLDMFAGTPNLETLALFEPGRGRSGRRGAASDMPTTPHRKDEA